MSGGEGFEATTGLFTGASGMLSAWFAAQATQELRKSQCVIKLSQKAKESKIVELSTQLIK